MNTHKTTLLTVIMASSLLGNAWAHDPKLHKSTGEKPNCEAMKDMDHTEMDTDDPVMRAMMAKCRSQRTEADTLKKVPLGESKTPYRKKIGHDAPMLESAPPHERADHRKTYEVADCENMSNMHHSEFADAFDPITKEMMEQCEEKPDATDAAAAADDSQSKEHDEGHHD